LLPESFDVRQQELGSVAEFVACYLRLEGPAFTVSTACSSSALALASGRRLLNAGLADVVIAGGADSLCRLTVNGFRALSALSSGYCNPFSRNRDGTMIGEGAAVFLMQREEAEIALYGAGASSDAYSMTAPEPQGHGVELAVRQALQDADLSPEDIDYIQLHGTATQQNDAMESALVRRLFGDGTPCSSSKGQVGHTLGAAGAMGAAHCWLAAGDLNCEALLPPHVWDGEAEEELLNDTLVQPGQKLDPTRKGIFLSNAFAFGGSNLSLVIGRWR
jgi:3-oxoacyl-[acyl-carrier-protein] synthase-1